MLLLHSSSWCPTTSASSHSPTMPLSGLWCRILAVLSKAPSLSSHGLRVTLRRSCSRLLSLLSTHPSASSRVFAIHGLIERILLHLSHQTLLLSQRTCKTWKNVIRGSRKLQDTLFLSPRPMTSCFHTWGPFLKTNQLPFRRVVWEYDNKLVRGRGTQRSDTIPAIPIETPLQYPASYRLMLLTQPSVDVGLFWFHKLPRGSTLLKSNCRTVDDVGRGILHRLRKRNPFYNPYIKVFFGPSATGQLALYAFSSGPQGGRRPASRPMRLTPEIDISEARLAGEWA